MKKLFLISGPCSAETQEQVFRTAEGLKSIGVDCFRAGLWKPRTRPGHFEGVGDEGIAWMKMVKEKLGMRICTEVAFREHVELCRKAGFDMVWIGARTTANPFLVQELADALKGSGMSVLVKNPVNPDVNLWVGAVERFRNAGVEDISVIHRGFSSYEKYKYRNAPGWQIVSEFRTKCPDIPVLCDPSHLSGSAELVPEVCQRAVDLGYDGLMIESHCNPSEALSDAGQQLTPEAVGLLLHNLIRERRSIDDVDSGKFISALRNEIDAVDTDILKDLGRRMEISRRIGDYKKSNNIPVIQSGRWEEVIRSASSEAKNYGLREDFVKSIFSIIHDASIEEQN